MIEIDFSTYTELLFKSKSEPEIIGLLELLGESFRKSEYVDHYYQVYEDLGIELVFSSEHYFQRFIIHNGFQDQIKTTLPYGLDFSFSMKQVEDILGFPEHSSQGHEKYDYWSSYPEYGVGFDYHTKSKDDLEAGIKHISFNYPQSDETRLAFHNRSQMNIFFQIRSDAYSPDLIGELLKLSPTRFDLEDSNLFEILITGNPHFSPKSQLRSLEQFIKENRSNLIKNTHDMELNVKFSVYSLRSNSFKLQIPPHILSELNGLGATVDFDFRT